MNHLHDQLMAAPLLITLGTSILCGSEPPQRSIGMGIGGDPSGSAGMSVFTTKTNSLIRAVTAAPTITPLETSLMLWRKGDQKGAVERFLQIDWTHNKPPFQSGSPLTTREQDLTKMSDGQREALKRLVNAQLKDLKQLAGAARDKALATTDKSAGQRYLTKLDECGVALDQSDALLILKLTARSIRKMATSPATAH